MEEETGRRKCDADQRCGVLDDEGTQSRVGGTPQKPDDRQIPKRRLPPRRREACEQRDPVGRECDRKDDPADEELVDARSMLQLVNREGDRDATADQEREDRRQEGPEKTGTAVAERMYGIGGSLGPAQGDPEHHLVDRVGSGVGCLG